MVVTVASMKGGVGKTTIASMLARYLSLMNKKKIILVDMDPQGGASSILLGGTVKHPTLVDVLRLEEEGIPSSHLVNQAASTCRHDENIFVIPGHAELAAFANKSPRLSCLKHALEGATFPMDAISIIDTGTHPTLVAMGIASADVVLIPVMLSQQTAKPTINTLKVAVQYRGMRGALLPMGIGNAKWESRELERWQQKLQASPALNQMGFEVLPGLPYSRAILRGRWRYGTFPKPFAPIMDGICEFIFQRVPRGETSGEISHQPDLLIDTVRGNGRGRPTVSVGHELVEKAHDR